LRREFLISGILLCLIGAGVIFYQINESCEDSTLAGAYKGYPWCTDILDRINFTFLGVLAVLAGVVIIMLGGRLHWILESSPAADFALDQNYTSGAH
jgi:uncharacterized membrane protein